MGDRFEAFAFAVAAFIARIPIAHLYGGEATFGAIDEGIRHSITKMSHLHFTSTEIYRKRVVQLGEYPERVFNVGAIGLDNIRGLDLLSREDLENKLRIKFNRRNLLVTFHPVTLENRTSGDQFGNLLAVLDKLEETTIIFTKANADTNGRIINRMIDDYTLQNPQKAFAFTSMGQLNYLSTMQFVDAVVGNSSSGIIEAPSFRIGTINIGDRQSGRVRAQSVIDCEPTLEGIRIALRKLYSREFQEILKTVINPFGDGKTTGRLKKVIKSFDISHIVKKPFYDIDFLIGNGHDAK
jgi:GDP/UDP-N,N'-diacetylbacillosamine 2-epimerase (hydrolysing)